jgi:uncharacterized protein YjbI with pentapeptide repeats
MEGIVITKSKLFRIKALECNMEGSQLEGSSFELPYFEKTTLYKSNLNNIEMKSAGFYKSEIQFCQIKNCTFKDVIVNDSNFIGSDLTDTKMQGDILESSHFGDCILLRTDFSGSTLKGRLWSNPNFRGAKAKNVNFSHCRFDFVSMLHADLENADFSKSNIELLDAQSANLRNARFIDSSLNGLNLASSDLTNADFTKATFVQHIILQRAILEGTVFDYVTLFQNPEIDLKDTIYEGKSLPIKTFH